MMKMPKANPKGPKDPIIRHYSTLVADHSEFSSLIFGSVFLSMKCLDLSGGR